MENAVISMADEEDSEMGLEDITAKLGKEDDAPSVTVKYDFGDNLEDATDKFGDEVVYKRFRAAGVIDVQALIRRHMGGEEPKDQKAIQAIVDEWKPGVTKARKSQKDKALDALSKLSETDRDALLSELLAA